MDETLKKVLDDYDAWAAQNPPQPVGIDDAAILADYDAWAKQNPMAQQQKPAQMQVQQPAQIPVLQPVQQQAQQSTSRRSSGGRRSSKKTEENTVNNAVLAMEETKARQQAQLEERRAALTKKRQERSEKAQAMLGRGGNKASVGTQEKDTSAAFGSGAEVGSGTQQVSGLDRYMQNMPNKKRTKREVEQAQEKGAERYAESQRRQDAQAFANARKNREVERITKDYRDAVSEHESSAADFKKKYGIDAEQLLSNRETSYMGGEAYDQDAEMLNDAYKVQEAKNRAASESLKQSAKGFTYGLGTQYAEMVGNVRALGDSRPEGDAERGASYLRGEVDPEIVGAVERVKSGDYSLVDMALARAVYSDLDKYYYEGNGAEAFEELQSLRNALSSEFASQEQLDELRAINDAYGETNPVANILGNMTGKAVEYAGINKLGKAIGATQKLAKAAKGIPVLGKVMSGIGFAEGNGIASLAKGFIPELAADLAWNQIGDALVQDIPAYISDINRGMGSEYALEHLKENAAENAGWNAAMAGLGMFGRMGLEGLGYFRNQMQAAHDAASAIPRLADDVIEATDDVAKTLPVVQPVDDVAKMADNIPVRQAEEALESAGDAVRANDVGNSIKGDNLKQQQFDAIQKSNPAPDDYHTWIRDPDEIKTFDEAWMEEPDIAPDFTDDMAQEAMRTGKITVYSSQDIENGAFVTPSYMEAVSYAGDPSGVKSATVNLDDVAWIDSNQGQIARVTGSQQEIPQVKPESNQAKYSRYELYTEGKTPQNKSGDANSIDIPEENFEAVKKQVEQVAEGDRKKISIARNFYEKIFNKKGSRPVTMNNITFDGSPYVVQINKTPAGELARHGINADDAIVWENVDDIVKNGTFLESTKVHRHGANPKRNVIRYDKFESYATIGGEQRTVRFDVEVYKDTNNYKTHRVLHEISPIETASSSASDAYGVAATPRQLRDATTQSGFLSDNSVRQSTDYVNDGLRATDEAANGKGKILYADKEYDDIDLDDITTGRSIPASREPNMVTATGKERSYAKNVRTRRVEGVSDDVAADFKDNPEIYGVLTNAETAERAQEIMDEGFDAARNRFDSMLAAKDPASIPLGHSIAKELSAQGEHDAAAEILRRMSKELTSAGQFTQAAAITMMKDDPMTALQYAIKQIDAMNADGAKKFGKKWKDFSLTDAELALFDDIKPGDFDAIKAAYDQIGTRIGHEYPTTLLDKLLEGRKISMLLNTRTNIRNFGANPPTFAMRWMSDRVEAVGQNIAKIIDPDFEVTQSLRTGGTGKKIAKEISGGEIFDSLMEGNIGKHEMPVLKNAVVKNVQMFKGTNPVERFLDYATAGRYKSMLRNINEKAFGKAGVESGLETLRNLTYKLLDLGDSPFVKKNFESRLASYINAQGIKNAADVPPEAIQMAWAEAMKATYKDDSWAVKVISDARNSITKIPVVGRPLSQAAIPFVQAPGNIAARMVDYSPIRGAKGVADIIKGAKSGSQDMVRQGIEEVAKGLTGTGLVVLGMKLYESGILTGAYSEDKDQKQFQKQTGYREYALHIGDNYFTYNWAQPFAMPLMVGTMLSDAIHQSDDYDSDILNYFGVEGSTAGKVAGAVKKGVGASVNAWFDESPLQGLQELMGGGYGQSDIASNIGKVAVENFAQSFVPSSVNALAKSIDPVQRQTTDKSSDFGTQMNVLQSKIPGLSDDLPAKYDTWGREVRTAESKGGAFAAKFLIPGDYSYDKSEAIDTEINRLFDSTGEKKVFPNVAPNSVTIDGESHKLDSREISEMQRIMGQSSYEMANLLTESPAYDSMSDDDRVAALDSIYGASKALAERELFGKEPSSKYKKMVEAYDDGGAEAVLGTMIGKAIVESAGYSASSNAGKAVAEAAQSGDVEKAQEIVTGMQRFEEAGLKAYDYDHYQKAQQRIPTLTEDWYISSYRRIDTDGNKSIKQQEIIDAMNRSPKNAQMYMDVFWTNPNWKKIPVLQDNGEWKAK